MDNELLQQLVDKSLTKEELIAQIRLRLIAIDKLLKELAER